MILEEISGAVMDGEPGEVKEPCRQAIDENIQAGEILKQGLIAGMTEVGVLFKDGEMFVPEVLMSAKTLQAGVEYLFPYLKDAGIVSCGKVLAVTVEGDLHDIGLKLVQMMLEGAGFQVVNMGVDKSSKEIIARIKEENPDILAMSAMLTTTMDKMREVIEDIKGEGLDGKVQVMVGGAPISPAFAARIGAHYSSDATSAVSVAKELLGVK